MTKKGIALRVLAFVAVMGATLLFRINLCNMLFACGCQSEWSAAGQFCNIHMANMAHCPWCSHGWWGHQVPTWSIIFSQAAILFVPMNLSTTKRIILSVVAFFVVGGIIGIFFAKFSDYPVFLGMHL